jgi:hypothetical protein
MSNQNETITKLEFVMTLEENIVCQRYFSVRGYNPTARRSVELFDYMKDICDEFSLDLKDKTSDYLYEHQNYYIDPEEVSDGNERVKEHFLLTLKVGDVIFIQREFPAYHYPPKVRYAVDIRPKLKRILSNLSDILSSRSLETEYLGYQL